MIKWSGCLPQKKEAAENHTVDFLTASFYENGRRKICIYYTIFYEKRYPFFEKKLNFFNFFCNFLKKGVLFRKNKEKKGVAFIGNLWYKFYRTKEFKFVSLCCFRKSSIRKEVWLLFLYEKK